MITSQWKLKPMPLSFSKVLNQAAGSSLFISLLPSINHTAQPKTDREKTRSKTKVQYSALYRHNTPLDPASTSCSSWGPEHGWNLPRVPGRQGQMLVSWHSVPPTLHPKLKALKKKSLMEACSPRPLVWVFHSHCLTMKQKQELPKNTDSRRVAMAAWRDQGPSISDACQLNSFRTLTLNLFSSAPHPSTKQILAFWQHAFESWTLCLSGSSL